MDNSSAALRYPHKAIHLWLLALVCLGAFLMRSEGIGWPKLHPDEYPIGDWLGRTVHHAYIADAVYAGGFFALARPVQWICRTVSHVQTVFAYHQGLVDRVHDEAFDAILFARWFNVWLGTLTCLFLYGLVRRVTGSGGAGILAAALFAFAQYPVEHSHYGETDIAMVFMLAMALWLWVITLSARGGSAKGGENRRPWGFMAAALVSGFTAGTKFPLLLLVLIVLIMGLAGTCRPVFQRGIAPRFAGVACAGLGLGVFLVGFILANPMAAMDWDAFRTGLAWGQHRVYHETAVNLGLLKDQPHIRSLAHLQALAGGFTTLGWGWIILAAVGVPCAFLKPYRRFWPVLLLFPALYTLYWIFLAPWVRTQEFMNFLPTLAALALLPLALLWRARRPLFRLTAVIMACAALALSAWNGLQTASLFGWTDTRLLARQWLERHLPESATLAVESYAEAACPETRNLPVLLNKVEREGLPSLQAQGADYLLRAASVTGRGLVHPVTFRRYPEPQRLFDEFRAHTERLCAWGPLTRLPLATFVSPTVELWGLERFAPKYSLSLELPQPLFLSNTTEDEIGRPTFFSVGHKLGSAEGLLIDRHPRTLAVGGPPGPSGPIYLILNTEERGAVIRVRGFGRRHTVALAPYSVGIVPLARSCGGFGGKPFERITLSAAPQEDILYIPCYARLAFSPAEVARMCSELGHDETAWDALTGDALAQLPDVQRYQLAVRSGHWDLADRWAPEADKACAALFPLLRAPPAEVRINDHNGYYYNALARVRLQKPGALARQGMAPSQDYALDINQRWRVVLEPTEEGAAAPVAEEHLTLPVRVAHGQFELIGELRIKPEPVWKGKTVVMEYSLNHRETWMGAYDAQTPEGWTPFAARFSVATEIQPRIVIRSATPAELYFRNLELRWSLASALESTLRSLVMARAAHALHRGHAAEALFLLAPLDAAEDKPNALEIRQLTLQALLGVEDRTSSRLAAAARDVLALAPADYQSLTVLAATEPELQTQANSLAGNLKSPVACGSYVSLVGYAFDPGRRELTCVFEVLKNETPPLAVAFHIRRHGEWRRRQSAPLSARPWLYRGERVALTVTLNEKFGAIPDPGLIGLSLESAVTWHPGQLSIAGRPDAVIPLNELAR